LGMSLPGSGTALAVSAKRGQLAYQSGKRVVKIIEEDLLPRKIMVKEAFENAIRADMALGGSTNTVLHLLAIAYEAKVKLSLSSFDRISRQIPHLVNLRPGGENFMEDLEEAGGVPGLLNTLREHLADYPTVCGKSIKRIAEEGRVHNREIIRDLSCPYHKEGGIAVLYGSLAPEGAVVKQSAVAEQRKKLEGIVRVFDSEEEAVGAIHKDEINEGEIIVIRYEGPKGGPGMREMLSPTSAVVGMGLSQKAALITDGRFSGGTRGPCVGHISPEAQEGGCIALLKDGDKVLIDIPGRRLEVNLSSKELEERKKGWRRPACKIKEGYLARYSRLVGPASRGAVLG